MRRILTVALLALIPKVLPAQGFSAFLMWFDDGMGAPELPLADWCQGGTPFPDGSATVQIFWDENANGPDANDMLAPLCNDPPDCWQGPDGTVNYNQFLVNGETIWEQGPGYFFTDPPFASVNTLPDPPRYYLEIRHGNLLWRSSIITLVAGAQDVGPGTQMQFSFDCCVLIPPPPVSNLSASETECEAIHVAWDYPDTTTAVDSIFIYRDGLGTRIGQVGITDPYTYTDVDILPGEMHVYYVTVRRECGEQDSLMSVPVTVAGRRAPRSPTPQNVLASDDQVGQVTVSWSYLTIIALDGWRVKRNGSLIASLPATGVPGPRTYVDSSPLQSASYYEVVGYSNLCGEGQSAGDWGAPLGVGIGDEGPQTYSRSGLSVLPNPFNTMAQIDFSLTQAGRVRIIIYDLMGAVVSVILDSKIAAGTHSLRFDGSRLPSGVYFITMVAGPIQQTQKIVLLK